MPVRSQREAGSPDFAIVKMLLSDQESADADDRRQGEKQGCNERAAFGRIPGGPRLRIRRSDKLLLRLGQKLGGFPVDAGDGRRKSVALTAAVMTGSPEQVRNEAYKQRTANMRAIVARLTASQKELFEGVSKAASRPDVFTIF